MNRIFLALDKKEDEIRKTTARVNLDVNGVFERIDQSLGNLKKVSKIKTIFKNPRLFPNDGKRSFGCLLYDGVDSTIQEGIFGQLDQKFYEVCLSVYKACISRLPIHESDFSKIFTFMGVSPEPTTVPPPSTRIIRKNNSLPEDVNTEISDALQAFVSFFFKENYYIPDNFVFKIKSSGNPGFPDSILYEGVEISKNDNPYNEESFRSFKKAIVLQHAKNFKISNKFADTLESNDLALLLNDFSMLYFYSDQHRGQPDVSSKERFGYTLRSWDTYDDDKDKEILLDKTEVLSKYYKNFGHLFNTYGDFVIKAKKYRFVFAESASTNTVPNLILSCIRKNYGLNFATVYKCGDPDTLNSTFNEYKNKFGINLVNKDIFCFDITQFDNCISPNMLKAYIRGIEDVSPQLANEICKISTAPGGICGPYYNLDPRSARNKIFLTGNPLDISSFSFGVSPSGTADVSEKAKIICSFFVLYSIFGKNVEKWRKILKGEDPSFLFFNLGDNNFIIADKNLGAKEKIMRSQIFKIDISDEMIFGGTICDIDLNKNQLNFRYNPGSILMKILAPERPIDDPLRSSYNLGTEFRYDIALSDNKIAIILETIDRVMKDKFFCSSQLELARRIHSSSIDKSLIYEKLQTFISNFGKANLSKFFLDILDSGGDKLFYTDLYEKLDDFEKRIIDSLFFSTFDEEEVKPILDYYGLRRF